MYKMTGYGPGALLFGDEERKELLDVMEKGFLFRYGEEDDPDFKSKVYNFERELASYMGVGHAVAVSSGTSSLLCALAALGIGPGDEVIVPGYTFIASISSIVNSRAIPVLAEVDDSLTIDPEDIVKKITPKTKAIMPVHMIGNPSAMDKIMDIAKQRGLFVIEDCCQAMGGSFKGKKLGTFGDIGCFSLNRYKSINCGDGGALVTNDKTLYERAFAYHDQGHLPNRKGTEQGHRALFGLNFRMNELSGAVAIAQLRKLDHVIDTLRAKKKIVKDFVRQVDGVGFRRLNDEEGECATLFTLMFKDADTAKRFADIIGTKQVYYSGWHVYDHMEQLLEQKTVTEFKCPFECPVYGDAIGYRAHMLPKTDDYLLRSVSIGIGVNDKGNGASYGTSILSGDDEMLEMANRLADALKQVL